MLHWKLFFTLVSAAIVSFLLIRWLRQIESTAFVPAVQSPRREMGFAAIAKQRKEMELEAA